MGERDFGGFLGLLGFDDVELEFAGGRDGEVFEVGRGAGGCGGRRGFGGGFREGGGRCGRGFGGGDGFSRLVGGGAGGGFGEGVFGGFGGEGLFASARADGRGGGGGGEGCGGGNGDAGGGFLLGADFAFFGEFGGEGGFLFGACFAPGGESRVNPVDLGTDVARENIQHRGGVNHAEQEGGADGAGWFVQEAFVKTFANVAAGPVGEVIAEFEEIDHRPQAAKGCDGDDHGHDARAGEVAAGLDREIDDPAEKHRNQPRAGPEAKQ